MQSFVWVFDDEWNASQGGFVGLMESSMKKSFKFDEMCFEFKWMGSDVIETWKCFSLKNFICEEKLPKVMLEPLFSKEMCLCFPTQTPLSLPKW